MNTKRNILIALLTVVSLSAEAAGPRWWHQLSSSTVKKDTQVSLQDATGATRTVLSNPAASKAAPGVGSSNQPLTVVVQATTGYWKDPVADWATLTGLPAANNKVGDARQVLNIKRAFTWDGSAWQPLAADQNNVMKAGKFQVGDIVTEGNRCSDNTNAAPGPADIALNGQIARDANGLILSCQSGSWKGSSSSRPFYNRIYVPFWGCGQGFGMTLGRHKYCRLEGFYAHCGGAGFGMGVTADNPTELLNTGTTTWSASWHDSHGYAVCED
ncbi:hypothetical protein ACPRNU_14045 [Chromobacterium vaccinii]|uniref:hypothetical protein n=1 Tax=Chromobacterium vaccinii TaxID=1108595 RepID=UPI003C74F4EA